jgi:hypothetical protein
MSRPLAQASADLNTRRSDRGFRDSAPASGLPQRVPLQRMEVP